MPATLKTTNIQNPSSANVNMVLTTSGSVQLPTVPFIEMTQTITADYTINTGMNALTPGPISIANGVFITIPDGSFWSVT